MQIENIGNIIFTIAKILIANSTISGYTLFIFVTLKDYLKFI